MEYYSTIKRNKCIYTHHSFFVHSSVNGHLGFFHDLPVVNSAVMNIGVYMSFSALISLGYKLRNEIIGS